MSGLVLDLDGLTFDEKAAFLDVGEAGPDLLRRSPGARDQYEAVKLRLIEESGQGQKAYTDGKSDVVRSLLGERGQGRLAD